MNWNAFRTRMQVSVILAFLTGGGTCNAIELTSSYPERNAGDVSRSTSIYLRFSKPISADTLQGLTLHGPKEGVFSELPITCSAGLTSDLVDPRSHSINPPEEECLRRSDSKKSTESTDIPHWPDKSFLQILSGRFPTF